MSKLLILGAGGYGRTVADVAAQMGLYETIAFLDDGQTGPHILGPCADFDKFPGWHIYPAFGDCAIRWSWVRKLTGEGITVPTLIHPRAYVSPTAKIGPGTVILPGAMVGTGVTVGAGCILNMGSVTDHDCSLGSGCHLAPGAIVKAENHIPDCTKIDSGEVIQNRAFPR